MAYDKRKNVYLVEKYEDDIKGAKLPSIEQVLCFFLYNHNKLNLTIQESATKTIEKVIGFWDKARIPIRYKYDCIKKVIKLFEKWKNLKKNAARETKTQKDKEAIFKSEFKNLFDIAHANALDMITIEEDRQFLLAQRESGRRGVMTTVDVTLKKKEARKRKKDEQFRQRQERSKEVKEIQQSKAVLEESTSASSAEEQEEQATTSSSLKRGRKQIVSPELAASLDRNKISDRAAVHVIGETMRSLGQKVQPLSLNRSSIRRSRNKHRKAIAAQIQTDFDSQFPLIVHWDGKLISDIVGTETVDRLPVIVTSNGQSQLLAVPKLPSGTGEAQANAIFAVLREWNLQEKVQGMCFDTTSSNTGQHKGTCTLLEQLIGHKLLHIGCHHHVLELIAGAAFGQAMGVSSAPDILLFKRFKSKWQFINQSAFEDSSTDEYTKNAVAPFKDEIVGKLQAAILTKQPRDDYKELFELALIFFGVAPPQGIHFKAPGAMHHARWMAKAIYTIKIWLFRSQFKLTVTEQRGLRDLCIFFSCLYVEAWAVSNVAIKAPSSDLNLLKKLERYQIINKEISKVALKKLAGQLWFLSEELVGLALFDDEVDNEIKNKMVLAMKQKENGNPLKRATIDSRHVQHMTLEDFASKNSHNLFKNMQLPDDFLEFPAHQWKHQPSFTAAKTFISSMAITNDHAERGIALIENFSGHFTKDEEQLQFALRVVADHRKKFPDFSKQTLLNNFE